MSVTLDEKFANLIKWVRDNGGFVHDNLILKGTSENRYMCSSSDISEKEKLFDIPVKCCITPDTYNSIPNINEEANKSTSEFKIVFALLYHLSLGSKSFYSSYCDILPRYSEFAYHPLYQYNDTLKESWSKISSLFVKTMDTLYQELDKMYKTFKECTAIDSAFVTFDNIKWCYMITLSRQWSVGLVPVADLFQHSSASGMALDVSTGTTFFMSTSKQITKDTIIYDTYGVQSDMKMLHGYGFVDDIENDTLQRFLPLTINISSGGSTLAKLKFMEATEYMKKNPIFVFTTNGIHEELRRLIRMSALSEKDFKNILIDTEYYKTMISVDNELSVYQNLFLLIKQQTDNFTDEEIKFSSFVSRTASPDTIEYKLAKAVLYQIKILDATIKHIIVGWNQLLGSPFKYDVVFNKYEKLING
jgi:hypothetical protein